MKHLSKIASEGDDNFAATALKTAVARGFLGGCARFENVSSKSPASTSDVYLQVLNDVSEFVGLQPSAVGPWIVCRRTSEHATSEDRNACAFVYWRSFWEARRKARDCVNEYREKMTAGVAAAEL